MEKLRMVEKEKSEFFSMQLRKQPDLETERRNEIERLKESHRYARTTGLFNSWAVSIDISCLLLMPLLVVEKIFEKKMINKNHPKIEL